MESENRRRGGAGCVNCITVKDKKRRQDQGQEIIILCDLSIRFSYQFINEAPSKLLGVFLDTKYLGKKLAGYAKFRGVGNR